MGCQCVKQENQLDQPTEEFSSPNQTKQLKSKNILSLQLIISETSQKQITLSLALYITQIKKL